MTQRLCAVAALLLAGPYSGWTTRKPATGSDMMTKTMPRQARKRVLLVSDDDVFSTGLKPCLPAVDVLSLTESSVWVANRAGIDVTRGIDAVLIDNHITGRLQLRLYEALRPSDRVAHVPVIFTRSKLTADSAGFDHALDVYQPQTDGPAETARLVADVLGTPASVPRMTRTAHAGGASRGPTLLQRLGLWGVAASLLAFTFWPLVGSGPVREVVAGPLQALAGGPGAVAEGQRTGR